MAIPTGFGLAQLKREGGYTGVRELLEDGRSARAADMLLRNGLTIAQVEEVFIKMGYPGGKPKPPPPPFDPNNVPALAAKLSDLVTMWEAKFGDRWASQSSIQGDEFWGNACARLHQNGLLEDLDCSGKWFRIKERA